LPLMIFLLFLAGVTALFVSINHISSQNQSNAMMAYLFLFLLLFLGVIWFLLTFNNRMPSESSISAQDVDPQENGNAEHVGFGVREGIQEVKKQVDIERIVPNHCKTAGEFSELILRNLAQEFDIVQGLMYLKTGDDDLYRSVAQYAYFSKSGPQEFRSGESLPGQAVKNRTIVTLTDIPENYMTIASGLGKSGITHLVFVPLIHGEDVVGLIEFATYTQVKDDSGKALATIAEKVAETIVKLIKK